VEELISLGVLKRATDVNILLVNNFPLFLVPKAGQPDQYRCIVNGKTGGRNEVRRHPRRNCLFSGLSILKLENITFTIVFLWVLVIRLRVQDDMGQLLFGLLLSQGFCFEVLLSITFFQASFYVAFSILTLGKDEYCWTQMGIPAFSCGYMMMIIFFTVLLLARSRQVLLIYHG